MLITVLAGIAIVTVVAMFIVGGMGALSQGAKGLALAAIPFIIGLHATGVTLAIALVVAAIRFLTANS